MISIKMNWLIFPLLAHILSTFLPVGSCSSCHFIHLNLSVGKTVKVIKNGHDSGNVISDAGFTFCLVNKF